MQFPIYIGGTPLFPETSCHDSSAWWGLQRGIWCAPASPASAALEPQPWRPSASSSTPCPGLLLSTPGILCPSCSGASHPAVPVPEHGVSPRPCAPALLCSTPIPQAAAPWAGSRMPWPYSGAPQNIKS